MHVQVNRLQFLQTLTGNINRKNIACMFNISEVLINLFLQSSMTEAYRDF